MNITVSHTISMGHRLPEYDGICSSPHGHNVKVEVHFKVEKGFLDFKVMKEHLEGILEDFDHAMVLYSKDPLALLLLNMGFRVVTLNAHPTTENIAAYVFSTFRHIIPEVVHVRVHETDKYSAGISLGHHIPYVAREEA